MTDRCGRLLLECQGFAASLEASHTDTLRMLALQLRGHPNAQDFEPNGHGGGEGFVPLQFDKDGRVIPDNAALDGKRYTKAIERAWTALREADDIRRRQIATERNQEPMDPTDPSEWCRGHLELDHYAPRYRLDMCRSCAERTYQAGDRPTKADIEYHAKHGRWPRKAVDPKQHVRRIAGLENLIDGMADITQAETL